MVWGAGMEGGNPSMKVDLIGIYLIFDYFYGIGLIKKSGQEIFFKNPCPVEIMLVRKLKEGTGIG